MEMMMQMTQLAERIRQLNAERQNNDRALQDKSSAFLNSLFTRFPKPPSSSSADADDTIQLVSQFLADVDHERDMVARNQVLLHETTLLYNNTLAAYEERLQREAEASMIQAFGADVFTQSDDVLRTQLSKLGRAIHDFDEYSMHPDDTGLHMKEEERKRYVLLQDYLEKKRGIPSSLDGNGTTRFSRRR